MLLCPPQAPLFSLAVGAPPPKWPRSGPVSVQEMRVALVLCRCFFAAITPHQLARCACWWGEEGLLVLVHGKGGHRKKGALPAALVLLRQNRQAKLASLKDDLLRYLLFGVDPIGNEKETQKFESQSVASSQGRLPCALVVLLRRETTPLYVHKRQIGGQISANEPNNETRQAESPHAAAHRPSGNAAPSRREAALMLRTTRTAST